MAVNLNLILITLILVNMILMHLFLVQDESFSNLESNGEFLQFSSICLTFNKLQIEIDPIFCSLFTAFINLAAIQH